MNQNKNILVFGAAGFIGTYLIEELKNQGYNVVASDISEVGERYYKEHQVEYVSVDITKEAEFEKLEARNFFGVLHLAALQPATFGGVKCTAADYMNINVMGTLNILEFCRKNGVRKVVYASSHRNTSGLWKDKRIVTEADGRSQEYKGEYSMFGISESSAQDLVEFYRANYDLQGVIFRLPPVYGFGPHLEIFKNGVPIKTGFQTFIENAIAGSPIDVWGDTSVGRDIVYVKDVVDAFMKVLLSDTAGGLYNISTGYSLTLQEEINTILKVFWTKDTAPQLNYMPEKKHSIEAFTYDNSKAKREFGWEPQYNFEALLRDYWKEVQRNKFAFLIEKREKMFNNEKQK